MRKTWKTLITLMILSLLAALALLPAFSQAETLGTMKSSVTLMTGPGDSYVPLPGMSLHKGDRVTVRTQYYSGGQTWLQVAFSYQGRQVRGYVPATAVNASLREVPVEAPLCAGVITENTTTYAGPYGIAWDGGIRVGRSTLIYEVEEGWLHIEYWNNVPGKRVRSWVPLMAVKAEMALCFTGYYGVAEETSLLVPSPTKPPVTYYGATYGYPVGQMCTVVAGSCRIRENPGEDWPIVAYAYVGDRFEVLDCCIGSTGKDWYMVRQDGVYGWMSSSLVSLD